jgi:hypothetical protein
MKDYVELTLEVCLEHTQPPHWLRTVFGNQFLASVTHCANDAFGVATGSVGMSICEKCWEKQNA